jgi:hypothetical protein
LLGGGRSSGDVGEISCILACCTSFSQNKFNFITSLASCCSLFLTSFLPFSKSFQMVFATSKDAAPLVEQCPLWPPLSKMCQHKIEPATRPLYPSTPLPFYPSTLLPLYPSTPLPLYPSAPLPLYYLVSRSIRSRHPPLIQTVFMDVPEVLRPAPLRHTARFVKCSTQSTSNFSIHHDNNNRLSARR